MTNTAIVVTGDTWVNVKIPNFNPASLRRALSAAASVHNFAAVTEITGETCGGLSGSAELGTMAEVDNAAERALVSLQEDGYNVALLEI